MKLTIGRDASYDASTAGPKPGREMSGHTSRSGTTIHGKGSIGFGSIFVIAGLTVGVLGWQGKLNASPGVPLWLAPVIGAVFALAGASFVVHGFRGVAMTRRVAALRAYHEREPWIWDHPWDAAGSSDDTGRRIAQAVSFAMFLALFLVPFNWIAFFSPERPLVFQVVTGIFDLVLGGLIWRAIYLTARRRKYGETWLRFTRFPFSVGGELDVALVCNGPLDAAAGVDGTLRCVQERYETRRSGKNRQSVVVSYEVWATSARASIVRGELVWRFAVPEHLPGTVLSERPPRYWELEVKAETAGIDYGGVFLVPVYEDRRVNGAAGERRRVG